MIRFRVTLYDRIDAYTREVEAGLALAVHNALYNVWADAVRIIILNRFETGELAGSTRVDEKTPLRGIVRSDAPYASFQHDGFIHYVTKQVVPGEPWFVQAAKNVKNSFHDDVRKALRKAA